MAKRNFEDRLIERSSIKDELRLIEGSSIEYITRYGNIYTDYGEGKMYPKKNFINKVNGYVYCNVNLGGKMFQRRVHILVAKAFIPNPNNFPIVMHLDNDKSNPRWDNLKWGTVQENSKNSFLDGLSKNDKGWEDSQSIHIACFDLGFNLIEKYGSMREAADAYRVTLGCVAYQCKHKVKSKPRKGVYFRFLSEYEKYGFVL